MEKSIAQHPKIYIIILNYNGWQDTIECVESVFHSSYSEYRIVIVDNASPNDSLAQIRCWAKGECRFEEEVRYPELVYPNVSKPLDVTYCQEQETYENINLKDQEIIVIKSNKNRGFASGNNIGMKLALAQKECDFIWLLNNDTVVEKNTLATMISKYKSVDEKIGVMGSTLYYYDNPEVMQGRGRLLTC